MQCSAVQCSAVQCSAVQCSAVQYSTVQYVTSNHLTASVTTLLHQYLQYITNNHATTSVTTPLYQLFLRQPWLWWREIAEGCLPTEHRGLSSTGSVALGMFPGRRLSEAGQPVTLTLSIMYPLLRIERAVPSIMYFLYQQCGHVNTNCTVLTRSTWG